MRVVPMSGNPYPHRWITWCTCCPWRMTAYDLDRACTSGQVHTRLKPGHVSHTEAIR